MEEMVDQSKRLLDLLGIPWVQAPAEGEAQASAMARTGVAYAAASQDFDSLLFGSPRLVKNLAITGRRKLPRKDIYVDVQPEEISLEATLANLGITREQLVDMGLLIGTDFNEGVKGIGPKKALALIKKHGSLEPALEELSVEIESKDEVREIFLKPNVLPEVDLRFRDPDADGVRRMLCDEHDFSPDRINAALAKFGSARSEQKQRSLDTWYARSENRGGKAINGPRFARAMPLDFVSSVLVSTGLTGALSALAYRRNVLTRDGSLAAFVVRMVIAVFGDVTWLFLLLLFLLSSFLANRYPFALKVSVVVP